MKKNLMIVSFAFIFLLSLSIVSAGITGYLVTRGGGIAEAGTTATLQGVRDGVATIAVTTKAGDTQVVRVREGETAQVGAATISASSLTRGTLFRRAGANIALNISNISAAPVPIKVPGAIFSSGNQTNATGNASCIVCTEKYKVLEGEVQVVQGNNISIDYIDTDSTQLSVDGGITSDLLEGQTFQLDYGEIVTIKDVYHPGIGGQIGEVELCLSGCYKVLEGEVQIVKGDSISIDYIDIDSTALSVNGAITSDLLESQTFKLTNGQIVTIKDVYHPGIGGQIGEVEFCLSSSY